MIVKVKRAFKSYSFLSPQKAKAERLYMKFSSIPIQVDRGDSIPYFRINDPFLLRTSKPPGQDQQNGKQCQLPC